MTTKISSIVIVFIILAQFMNAVNDFAKSESLDNLENRANKIEAQLEQLN